MTDGIDTAVRFCPLAIVSSRHLVILVSRYETGVALRLEPERFPVLWTSPNKLARGGPSSDPSSDASSDARGT
jgi:hypothetical protein